MAYTKQVWEDSPSTSTPLSSARLTHIEDGIGAAHDGVDATNVSLAGLGQVVSQQGQDTTALSSRVDGVESTANSALQPWQVSLAGKTGKYTDLTAIPDGLMQMMGSWDAAANNPVLADNAAAQVQSSVGFTGISSTRGVAVGLDGTVYVSITNQVYKITPAGVQSSLGFTGLSNCGGVAVDSDNTVYVVDQNANQIYKKTVSGVQSSVGFTSVPNIYMVAVDSDGTVYAGPSSGIYVVSKTVSGTQVNINMSPAQRVFSVAVDANKTIYVVDATQNQAYKRPVGGSVSSVGFTGLTGLRDVAVDPSGTVYVTSTQGVVKRTTSGVQTAVSFLGIAPFDLAVDVNRAVYASDINLGKVYVISSAPNADRAKGHMYRIANGGSANLGSGATTFTTGRWMLHDGTQWGQL